MIDAKCTPVPWGVKKHLEGGGPGCEPYEMTRIALPFNKSGFSQTIASLPIGSKAEHAHLIAASPAMYVALVASLQKHKSYVGICDGDKELTDDIIPSIEAALAKARGEGGTS